MSDTILPPGTVRGPQLDKGQWPTFFDYQKSAEDETLFSPKSGFRFKDRAPHAHFSRGIAVSIPASTLIVVNFPTILADNFKVCKPNTAGYICPVEGLYLVELGVLFESSAWAVGNYIEIRAWNLTQNYYHRCGLFAVPTTTALSWGATGNTVLRCNKGDVIQMSVYHTAAGAKNLFTDGQYNYMIITKIGDL